MKSVMRGQVRFGEQSVVRASPSAFAHATQMANASAGRWSLTGWLGSLMPASTAPTTETPPPAPNPAQARNFPRSTEAAVQSSNSAAAAARPSPSQPASSRSVSAPVLSSTYTIDIEPHITRSAGPASTDLAPGSPLWASLDDATRTMLLYLREGSAKEAAGWRGKKLQARIRQLTADGEADKAFPLLCERTLRAFSAHGAESADTVLAVCSVAENTFQRSFVLAPLHCWLLPRYAQHFGIGHATTRALVLRAALEFCHPEDPRHPPEFLRVVTDLAQRLPGVLGWGSRVVAPVPDEQAYQMNVIMQAQAAEYMSHNDRLAKDMLQQCVTYYQSLGPHWLGTVRKVAALMHIGSCVRRLEGAKAAEPYKLAAKRAAQQQLGKKHPKTLEVMWDYGYLLIAQGRCEQASSVFQQTLRVAKEVLGPRHIKIINYQVAMADVLRKANKLTEAEALSMDTFETALKVGGPQDHTTRTAYLTVCQALRAQGKTSEELAFRERAGRLGCRTDFIPGG